MENRADGGGPRQGGQPIPTGKLTEKGVELKRGDVGVIVHIHPGGAAMVVEFMALDGDTLAIATVLPSQARPVSGGDMTHARPMEITA